MKRALAVVLAASFVGLLVGGAVAQVPNVQVYFDPAYGETQADCQSPGTPQTLYVVMNNWNMFVQAVDFSVEFPPALFFGGLTTPPNTLVLGNVADGVAIAWQLPQNGFGPLLAGTMNAFWTGGCDCGEGPQALIVRGRLSAGQPQPTATRWPDFTDHEGVGMTSLVCPGTIATEEKTWGGIKALYR